MDALYQGGETLFIHSVQVAHANSATACWKEKGLNKRQNELRCNAGFITLFYIDDEQHFFVEGKFKKLPDQLNSPYRKILFLDLNEKLLPSLDMHVLGGQAQKKKIS